MKWIHRMYTRVHKQCRIGNEINATTVNFSHALLRSTCTTIWNFIANKYAYAIHRNEEILTMIFLIWVTTGNGENILSNAEAIFPSNLTALDTVHGLWKIYLIIQDTLRRFEKIAYDKNYERIITLLGILLIPTTVRKMKMEWNYARM